MNFPATLVFLSFCLGGVCEDGFSAIKLTALGRPQFLVSDWSQVSVKWAQANTEFV